MLKARTDLTTHRNARLIQGASAADREQAAARIARSMGMNLYRVDLGAVVSKYIGETEKNLERLFARAESSNAILFFDEADALFGKRSEVKDAHDRYANIETAYSSLRLEAHDSGRTVLLGTSHDNVSLAKSRAALPLQFKPTKAHAVATASAIRPRKWPP